MILVILNVELKWDTRGIQLWFKRLYFTLIMAQVEHFLRVGNATSEIGA